MELDWKNLGFDYLPTNCFIKTEYKHGEWTRPVSSDDHSLNLSIASNVFHYGQACFEGLKAFRTQGGEVVLFRPEENAKRMQTSAERICMQAPPIDLFIKLCIDVVKQNLEYVPPYGTGASLYIRPTLIGNQPMVGVNSSDSYIFFVFVTPVGPYYKDGFSPIHATVMQEYDRSATLGTGHAKFAGNYAASLRPTALSKKNGYPIVLYTDSVDRKYIDEFGTSNFIGATKDNEYITPDSPSILKSITNNSLMKLAREEGMTVKQEKIACDDLNKFVEVGACGTAAIITPIHSITRGQDTWTFGDKNKAGPIMTRLREHLQGIQYGTRQDAHNWLMKV
jgi:branched-chain amino acid aminotransferase